MKGNQSLTRATSQNCLCPVHGCNNAALELHQEFAAYSFADDWRRGLMFSNEPESRSHEMILATMRASIAETWKNWEIVNKMNEKL